MLIAALGLTGCNSAPAPQTEPPDRGLSSGRKLARFAFEGGDYKQAVVLYERTLARAYARDDVEDIADIGYESALALLRADEPAKAATRARRVREELARRGVRSFPELQVTEAVALYAAGDPVGAEALAAAVASGAGEPVDASGAVRARAVYLQGMVAADRGDRAAVAQALATIGNPEAVSLQADRAELTGRLRLLDFDPGAAMTAFEEAIELRREGRDYAGVARALAFAGDAAAVADRPGEAADLYLRAGRGAAQLNRRNDAERWLRKAQAIATHTGQADVSDAARYHISKLGD
jgi:tetratricopeptide (TPR) repeat protein